jgi:hypothetical protein
MNALDFPSVRIPQAGDVILARGNSWIVERTEKAESVQTLYLVSCEDDSQGEAIQIASDERAASRPIRGALVRGSACRTAFCLTKPT